jgi:SAM-dependent methyltransferase
MTQSMLPPQVPASFQRILWSATSRDWADFQEPLLAPWYTAVLDDLQTGPGMRLLDVGCGAGLFLLMAGQRGALTSGVDITPEFIAIARQRSPMADLRLGDMNSLPFEDGTFDVVTGFNSFQMGGNPVPALVEARRVTCLGGRLVIGIFGRAEDCAMAAPLQAFTRLMPPPPPGSQGPFALSADGVLQRVVRQAGWGPLEQHEVEVPFEFDDETSALRCILSNGPAVIAIRTSGMERVRQAVLDSINQFRTASGGYYLENRFRYLIAHRAAEIQ